MASSMVGQWRSGGVGKEQGGRGVGQSKLGGGQDGQGCRRVAERRPKVYGSPTARVAACRAGIGGGCTGGAGGIRVRKCSSKLGSAEQKRRRPIGAQDVQLAGCPHACKGRWADGSGEYVAHLRARARAGEDKGQGVGEGEGDSGGEGEGNGTGRLDKLARAAWKPV